MSGPVVRTALDELRDELLVERFGPRRPARESAPQRAIQPQEIAERQRQLVDALDGDHLVAVDLPEVA